MRSAHEAVGKLVRQCEERRCRLADLPAEAFEAIRPGLGAKVHAGARRAERAGGVPELRLDGAGGSGAAVAAMAKSVGVVGSGKERFIAFRPRHPIGNAFSPSRT